MTKVCIISQRMKSIVEDFSKIAGNMGYEVTNNLNDDYDFIHLVYPLSKISIKAMLARKPILLHFHGDDTRPRQPHHLWLLKQVIKRSEIACYSTVDLTYNLDWLCPGMPLFELPAPVDTEFFKPRAQRKTRRFLIAGEMYKNKHWEYRYDEFKGYPIDSLDYGEDKDWYHEIAPPEVNWLPHQPFHKMPALYNKYKHMIPQASAAFELGLAHGRVELEALACGCKLVYTETDMVKEHWQDRDFVIHNNSFGAVADKMKTPYEVME